MVWRAILGKALFILFAAQLLLAESLPRVSGVVNDGVRTYRFGQIHPRARPECDIGRAPDYMPIYGASLVSSEVCSRSMTGSVHPRSSQKRACS